MDGGRRFDPQGSRASPALTGLKTLIVEDEAIVAFAIEAELIDQGAVVVGPAYNLDEALALIASETIDAAVLDINIGTHKIWPVAEQLHARAIPFLFVSANCNDPDIPPQFAAAFRLDKPVESDMLVAMLSLHRR